MTTSYRFAPSPTGYLHIGNARSALLNALMALKTGGTLLLRLDDTDRERCSEAFAVAISEDLHWLGIRPDGLVRQSDRLTRYEAALARLKASGAVYPAYESAEELERKRRRQQALGRPPLYDRAALRLTDTDRAQLESDGRRPHWRLKLSGATVTWDDGVRGPSHIETSALSDPVLVREDGTMLYTFASVVDDAELGITDVIRGEDHVANTAVQIELFRALGAEPPRFSHHNLIASADGAEMSKRLGSLSLRSFREAGAEPMAVACVAVLTGSSEPLRLVETLEELAKIVDLRHLSRALTKFDPADIAALSARALHGMSFESAAPRLRMLGIEGELAGPFWLAVRGNLPNLAEARVWWDILHQRPAPVSGEADVLDLAANLLPPEPWTDQTWTDAAWSAWTNALKEASGRKGRALFQPLRLALTGRQDGPELKVLLPLLGRRESEARLRAPSA